MIALPGQRLARAGKRLALFALSGALVLAGLGNQGIGRAAAPHKTLSIVIIPGTAGDEYYATVDRYAVATAKRLGVNISVQLPSTFSPAAQTPVLDAAIARHPDAILIAPTDRRAMIAPLKQAAQQGIKILLFDTQLDDMSFVSASVHSDAVTAGKIIANTMDTLIGNRGKVLFISVAPGVSTTDNWIKGFKQVEASHPTVTVLPIQYSNNDEATAANIMSGTLLHDPDLAGAFLGNLVSERGSIAALKSSGKLHTIKTIAYDATPSEVKDLKAGNIDAIITARPGIYGTKLVTLAVAVLNGKKVQFDNPYAPCVLTRATVASPQNAPCLYQAL